ncbi:hypothetical protein EVAR_44387_1 [Eumeta japonica]|uniref:Uncharacterized protein n=1 Tax=Eumeta variegata TaxID=151549 RepID=A0A4C1XA73_EUMVA|nr:hypothetical protein EVAR_44387_1 [Eumeta japonica]
MGFCLRPAVGGDNLASCTSGHSPELFTALYNPKTSRPNGLGQVALRMHGCLRNNPNVKQLWRRARHWRERRGLRAEPLRPAPFLAIEPT